MGLWETILRNEGLRSWVLLPLRDGQNVIALLGLGSGSEDAFDDIEEPVLRAFALAIEPDVARMIVHAQRRAAARGLSSRPYGLRPRNATSCSSIGASAGTATSSSKNFPGPRCSGVMVLRNPSSIAIAIMGSIPCG